MKIVEMSRRFDQESRTMAAKLRVVFVIGLLAAGLLYADSRYRPRYGMTFCSLNWTVKTGGHRFGIAEYSFRKVAYAIRGDGKPLFPQISDSVVYLGPMGSFRASRFLIVATAFLLSLGVLVARMDRQRGSLE
jgi:hypothetical protein